MKINIYRRTRENAMVYSLESAKAFCEQSKRPIEIRIEKNKYLIVCLMRVQIVSRSYAGMIGIDFVEYESEGDEAVCDVYKLRKYINSYFRD